MNEKKKKEAIQLSIFPESKAPQKVYDISRRHKAVSKNSMAYRIKANGS